MMKPRNMNNGLLENASSSLEGAVLDYTWNTYVAGHLLELPRG